MAKKRIDIIHEMISYDSLTNDGIIEFTAEVLAHDLKYDRSNVSKDLNILWNKGLLIKIAGRPTKFVHLQTLKRNHPDTYIPNFISLGDSISNYVYKNEDGKHNNEKLQYSMEDFGVVKELFNQAKAAISYPKYGLPILICGAMGIGKFRFVRHLYGYAVERSLINKNSKLVFLNCSEYSQASIARHLFGETTEAHEEIGLIEKSNNGILYIEGIEQLSHSNQQLLINLIDKQFYTKSGSPTQYKLNCHLILSSNHDVSSSSINSLVKFIPIKLQIPEINKREPIEKVFVLHQFLKEEASIIFSTIRISKKVFSILCEAEILNEIGEIRNLIKTMVSHAYYHNFSEEINTVTLSLYNIPLDIRDKLKLKNTDSMIFDLINAIVDDYIYFVPTGYSNIERVYNLYDTQSIFIDRNQLENRSVSQAVETLETIYKSKFKYIENHYESPAQQYKVKLLHSLLQKNMSLEFLMKSKMLKFILMELINNLDIIISKDSQQFNFNELNRIFIAELIETFNLEKASDSHLKIEKIIELLREKSISLDYYYIILSDSRINTEAYKDIFSKKKIHNYTIYSLDKTISDGKLLSTISNDIKQNHRDTTILVITDIEHLQNLSDSLNLSDYNIIEFYPLSIVLLEKIINSVHSGFTNRDLRSTFILNNNQNLSFHSSKEDDGFLQMLNNKFLKNELVFLNPEKSSPLLFESLNKILTELSIVTSNRIIVKFIIHSSFMIERLISNKQLQFPNLKTFVDENYVLYQIIEKNLTSVFNAFGVESSPSEIAFLIQLLNN